MTTYSISAPDGQTYVIEGPQGATQAQVEAEVLRQHPNAGKPVTKEQLRGNIINTDVPTVVGERVSPPPVTEPKRSMMDYVKALGEVPYASVRGVVDPLYANALGIAKSIPQAIRTGQAPMPIGSQIAQQKLQEIQYQPTSPVTQDVLQTVGNVAEMAKISPSPVAIGELPSFAKQISSATPFVKPTVNRMAEALRQAPIVEKAMQTTEPVVTKMAEALRKTPQSTMSGVGSAEVDLPTQRYQMAQELPVPMNIRKSHAERELGQQKFESDIAKTYPETLGKDIIKSDMELNDAMLKNFDAFIDATGAERAGQFNLRQVGNVVDKALVKNAKKAWEDTNDAYKKAREAGEMQAPVSYAPLQEYIEKQTPTVKSKLAPILDAVDEQIKLNDPERIVVDPITNKKVKQPPTGQIPINSVEDIYEFINKHYEPDSPAATHAIEMKKIINQMMEGQGGELYQKARKLRTKYANEFENVGYVDKLLRNKPGTSDRAVALSDVFDHAILKGSLEDTRNVALALKKSPEGQQAWKELQGQTIQHIKDLVTKNMTKDSSGQVTIAPKRFNSIVSELDQEGKLDYIFGKQGAQQIRNLNEVASTTFDPLTGAVNYSNSGSAIIQGLERIAKATRLPGIGKIAEVAKHRELKKKVRESINYKPESMAKALKKGKSNE